MATNRRISGTADVALCYVKRMTRDDGSEYVGTAGDAPEWIRDMVHKAHGDMLPDDWRYQFVLDALQAIAEMDEDAEIEDLPHEAVDASTDVYTSELTRWLGSRADRIGYCDEQASAFGWDDDGGGTFKLLQLGQYAERMEVFESVLSSLTEIAEEMEDAEDD